MRVILSLFTINVVTLVACGLWSLVYQCTDGFRQCYEAVLIDGESKYFRAHMKLAILFLKPYFVKHCFAFLLSFSVHAARYYPDLYVYMVYGIYMAFTIWHEQLMQSGVL